MIVFQVNLGRSRISYDLAYATASRLRADILVASEPNKKLIKSGGWLTDGKGDVAVIFLNKKLRVGNVRLRQEYPAANYGGNTFMLHLCVTECPDNSLRGSHV